MCVGLHLADEATIISSRLQARALPATMYKPRGRGRGGAARARPYGMRGYGQTFRNGHLLPGRPLRGGFSPAGEPMWQQPSAYEEDYAYEYEQEDDTMYDSDAEEFDPYALYYSQFGDENNQAYEEAEYLYGGKCVCVCSCIQVPL